MIAELLRFIDRNMLYLPQEFGFKTGVLTTSNALDHHDVDDQIMFENGE